MSTWGRLLASEEELEARDERELTARLHVTPIERVRPRERVRVAGVLRSVTLSPARERPVLVAELYDGSGSLDLVWLGRRAIAGIAPGTRLLATGVLAHAAPPAVRSRLVDPAYELLPIGGVRSEA